MHLADKLARYAEAEMPMYRRSPQDGQGGTDTQGGSAQTSVAGNNPDPVTVTSQQPSAGQASSQQVTQPTTQVVVTQTNTPQPAKSTVTAKSSQAVVQSTTVIETTAAPAAAVAPTTTTTQVPVTVTSPTSLTSATNTATSYVPETVAGSSTQAGSATSAAAASSNSGTTSISGTQVATAVGVVAGIAGGIVALVLGICIYKRRRRKSMQRLGSSEDLARGGQSPPLLSRNRVMQSRPRRAIDDDDDDFLTPMDTLPNTHRMSQYGSGQHDHTAMYFEDSNQEHHAGDHALSHDQPSNNLYGQNGHNAPGPYDSVYIDDPNYDPTQDPHAHHQQAPMDPGFPVQPPAAVVPSNGRFFSGEMDRPHTPQGAGGSAGGAIPSYSAMNKYAAYTPQNAGGFGSRPGASGYRGAGGPDSGAYM